MASLLDIQHNGVKVFFEVAFQQFHASRIQILHLGTIHLGRWQIFMIFDPYPLQQQFFTNKLANFANSDPSLPLKMPTSQLEGPKKDP